MTRTVSVQLYGAFRDCAAEGRVELQVPVPAKVADLRRIFSAYGEQHWAGVFRPTLLAASAFASSREVLRDGDALPEVDADFAILPPVSGG